MTILIWIAGVLAFIFIVIPAGIFWTIFIVLSRDRDDDETELKDWL